MEPKYVTFEQGKWLKEKGFKNIEIDYGLNQMLNNCNPPEQWQVVEWLRVKHGIHVSEVNQARMESHFYQCEVSKDGKMCDFHLGCRSPQEAYSAAFDYIKNNNLI